MKLHLPNNSSLDPTRMHHDGAEKHYRCMACGAEFDFQKKPFRCPECKGGKLEEVKK